MISPTEMRILDRNAQHFGVSILDLMENAGKAVAEAARRDFSAAGKKVLVVCGTGNNGGDGFVAARLLAAEAHVTVLLARAPDQIATEEARTNFARLKNVRVLEGLDRSEGAMADADVIVDALLGIGAAGDLREPYAALIREMNASGKPILSVDVPSGLGANPAAQPKVTVSMYDAKEGMTPANSGTIRIADIGIPAQVARTIGPGEFLLFPRPKTESHKGQNGSLLIVSGGPFTGAPALVALGALGMGADLVHIATPALAAQVVAGYSPNFIVHPLVGHRLLREDVEIIVELSAKADALAIGPGLGDSPGTLESVRALIKAIDKPMVFDADAIRAVGQDTTVLAKRKAVATPHAREFTALTGKTLPDSLEERAKMVQEAAKTLGITILLKGHVDIVSDGTRTKLNHTGNAGMTVGGTGDVLCGAVGGLLCKGVEPYDAARLGAFSNGYAGDLAFKVKSYGLTATDVADNLGRVLAEFVD
jgi:NAD(P)H-hydrate epimerase